MENKKFKEIFSSIIMVLIVIWFILRFILKNSLSEFVSSVAMAMIGISYFMAYIDSYRKTKNKFDGVFMLISFIVIISGSILIVGFFVK